MKKRNILILMLAGLMLLLSACGSGTSKVAGVYEDRWSNTHIFAKDGTYARIEEDMASKTKECGKYSVEGDKVSINLHGNILMYKYSIEEGNLILMDLESEASGTEYVRVADAPDAAREFDSTSTYLEGRTNGGYNIFLKDGRCTYYSIDFTGSRKWITHDYSIENGVLKTTFFYDKSLYENSYKYQEFMFEKTDAELILYEINDGGNVSDEGRIYRWETFTLEDIPNEYPWSEMPFKSLTSADKDDEENYEDDAPEYVPMTNKKVTINVKDGINIRKGPGTDFGKVGLAEYEEEYEIFSVVEADGFTWYEIDEDQWIADDGTWLIKNFE